MLPKTFFSHLLSIELFSLQYNFNSLNIQNGFRLGRLAAKEYFQKLREPRGFNEWFEKLPTVINAYYMRWFNKIGKTSSSTITCTIYIYFFQVLPAAYLQPPLFHKDAPK